MIVIDASAMCEALIGCNCDSELLDALAGDVAAPHLLDVEVLSAVRGLPLGGKLEPEAAEEARVNHFTCYDAPYLALAEALDAPLYTCDGKLAGAVHQVPVRVFPRTH